MKCENCNERNATVHIKKTINGETMEANLCEECAKKLNAISDFGFFETGNFLSSLFDPYSSDKQSLTQGGVCPNCGTTLSDYSKSGYVGCSKCYKQFRNSLSGVIRRVHGNTKHIGKIPVGLEENMSRVKEYEILSQKLKEAVSAEDYEQAVIIRDKLKKLSGKER